MKARGKPQLHSVTRLLHFKKLRKWLIQVSKWKNMGISAEELKVWVAIGIAVLALIGSTLAPLITGYWNYKIQLKAQEHEHTMEYLRRAGEATAGNRRRLWDLYGECSGLVIAAVSADMDEFHAHMERASLLMSQGEDAHFLPPELDDIVKQMNTAVGTCLLQTRRQIADGTVDRLVGKELLSPVYLGARKFSVAASVWKKHNWSQAFPKRPIVDADELADWDADLEIWFNEFPWPSDEYVSTASLLKK